MMGFFLVLSFFKGRFWCWNLCPRGAFLDIVMPKASQNRYTPKIFSKLWFRWSIFSAFMAFIAYRVISTGGNLLLVGGVFVFACIVTTIISIALAMFTRPRAWCAVCPMGLLQQTIYGLQPKGNK